MANLCSGEVTYLRRVNTGNYEHKEFSAKISWNADQAQTDAQAGELVERAADMAVRVVHERLGITPPVSSVSDHVAKAVEKAIEKAPETAKAIEKAITEPTASLPKRHKKVEPNGEPSPLANGAGSSEAPTASSPVSTEEAPTEQASGTPMPAADVEDLLGDPETSVAVLEAEFKDEPANWSQEDWNIKSLKAANKVINPKEGGDGTKFPQFKLNLPKFEPQIAAIKGAKRALFLDWLSGKDVTLPGGVLVRAL